MITSTEEKILLNIIKNNQGKIVNKNFSYPLLENGFDEKDILRGIEVLLSRKLTMSQITEKFERNFAKYVGSKYAVMVNSGSSANLLSAFALINPKKENRLRYGDKFLIPAICWSTSLWPFIQSGLKPVFTDVSKKDFCIQVDELDNKKLKAIKLIVSINILGNSPDIKNLSNICKKKNIYLVEDTCEALGSKMNSKSLGTYGDFGTFSFYYSHQITSGEGGMVVCNKKEDYEILRTLRAHGWDRHVKNRKQNTFNFVNSGFNLRPLDITAAIGISQLKRLNEMKKIRNLNKVKIISCIKNHPEWNDQYEFFEARKGLSPSWFGFPILLNKKYRQKKILLMKYLNKNKIETRPILSGNFLNQPSVSLYNLKPKKNFNNAQEIEERGFFIGIPTTVLTNQKINYLVKKLMFIERI
tara:strand:+ start:1381 stop:2622 length:1242 start_codon:yes stop_codon:yes gene_type:complete